MSEDLNDLMKRYERFIRERDWTQFHTPKNVSMAIAVEAAELMELFQWHDSLPPEEIKSDPELMARVEDELADVLIYSLSMAIHLDIAPEEIIAKKLEADEERYDTDQADELRSDLLEWKSSERYRG